jgi:hydroxybutyrate-dimer hydrolase
MKASRGIVGASLAFTLVACGGGTATTDTSDMAQAQGRSSFVQAPNIAPPWLGTVRSASYDGITDDLLTGGLGKDGLAFASLAPATSNPPTAAELRRLAIYNNYRAIVDVNPAGGYGTLYGPNVGVDGVAGAGQGKIAGKEYIAYAALGNARENVTLMVQVPDSFDPAKACIVTGTSSGSRGVYGAIGSSGEWGLKRGCAVAYADKGSGLGVHNLNDDTVNLIDGLRTTADVAGAASNFTANITAQQRQDFNANTPNRLAVKHAHSEQNPEKDWGRDTLRAVEFALYVLNEQYGATLPSGKKSRVITPGNTIVIASSVSNGAGAALAAAEEDKFGLIDGVAVTEPNIQISPPSAPMIKRGTLTYTGGSKPLYDFFTYGNLYQPCAALSTRAAGAPFAVAIVVPRAQARCASLAEKGLLASATLAEQAEEALDKLLAYGWEPESNVLHPSHYALATASITMTYSNAHGRFSVLDNLCGLSFAFTNAAGQVIAPLQPALNTIFGTGNGVPPMAGIQIVNNNSVGGPLLEGASTSPSTNRTDYNIDGALCQRELITGSSPNAQRVQLGVKQVQKSANLQGKPAIIVHGRSDTLVPTNFSSRPYYARNQQVEGAASKLRYIEVTNAQHFDAFLANPGLGYNTRYVPLHVYFNRAMDAMYAHLTNGAALPPSQVVKTTPRGAGAPPITPANVPPILAVPGDNAITFDGTTLTIPD